MLLDGYIRVSQVAGRSGPSFISPVSQREDIERWAAAQGALIGQIFEELDESGGRTDRPLLLEAIRRVEDRETDGVIVPYLSRFGRSLLDALIAIKRIKDAGGTFVSVQEGLDLSNYTGRLVLRTLLSIAEWERDRHRAYFDDARQRAIARGVPIGIAPVGYRRRKGGRLEVDPEAGPVVVELFRRRSSGERFGVLERWLEAEGQRLGRNWHLRASAVVSRRVYRGELRHGRFVNVTAHEPLVDEETWKRAQGNTGCLVPRRGARPALLRGLMRCAGCQRPLRVSWHNVGSSRESLSYHCTYKSGPCCEDKANIVDTLVEPYLEALFWQELPKLHRHSKRVGSRRLEVDLKRREEELVAYRDNPRLPRSLGGDRFAAGLEVRLRRVEIARRALSQVEASARPPTLPPRAELASRWPTMSIEERRAAIAEVIDCVYVSRRRGTRQPITDRLFVCLRGRGPAEVRYRGRNREGPVVPFDPSSCPVGPALKPVDRQVSTAVLRSELAAFVKGRRFWPGFQHFQACGRADLYANIRATGGVARWAAELGLRVEPSHRVLRAWPEHRIRHELRRYLKGKAQWPSTDEFVAAGLNEMRIAVRWTGGPERWAAEMGLPVKGTRRRTRRWSYAELRNAISGFSGDSGRWPTHRTLASVPGLEYATRRLDLRMQICRELDLTPPSRSYQRTKYWTDDQIQDALDHFLEGRQRWPTRPMFAEAGLLGLHETLRRRGIRDQWAERYGFRTTPP